MTTVRVLSPRHPVEPGPPAVDGFDVQRYRPRTASGGKRMRRIAHVIVIGIAVVGLAAPALAGGTGPVEVDDVLIPPEFLDPQGLVAAPTVTVVPPPDLPACEVFRTAFQDALTAGSPAARQEWHTPDAAFTLGQNVITPTGAGGAKAIYKTMGKPRAAIECLEAINGEDDDNELVDVDVEVTKAKIKIKGADGSAAYWVDGTYTPTTAPASYGRSLYIYLFFGNAYTDVAYAHFSMDQGDLDDFEDDADEFVSELKILIRTLNQNIE